MDLQEGSCDRTQWNLKSVKKINFRQSSAHYPRVFDHHEHLAALV
jgi:hypothetical protein